jgi:DNA polymerase III subunit delta
MNFFLERTGDDMETIRTELEKLISYTMGQEVVTREDIEAVTTVQVTNKIFDMVTAIVTGKTKTAMDLYEDLLTLKEPPMRILFLIARQFNQILLVKEMMASGNDKSAIASKLKIPPFVAGKLMPQARTFTREQLAGCVEACVEAEEAVKTGQLGDRLAVELMIMRKY